MLTLHFYLVIILMCSLAWDKSFAQAAGLPSQPDTTYLLSGKLQVALEESVITYSKSQIRQQKKNYSFDYITQIDGFMLRDSVFVTVFETSLDKPGDFDLGISVWKLLQSFSDNLTHSVWLQSGWDRMHNGEYLYYAKLADQRDEEVRFVQLYAFALPSNKLVIAQVEYPLKRQARVDGAVQHAVRNFTASLSPASRPRLSGF